jgi:hypothetical protein
MRQLSHCFVVVVFGATFGDAIFLWGGAALFEAGGSAFCLGGAFILGVFFF